MGGFFYPRGSSSGGSSLPGPVVFSSSISPSALAAGVTNDYSPSGLATATVLRIPTNAAGSTLGGLAAQPDGTIFIVLNIGSGDLILQDEGSGSIAANRFAMPADFLIPTDYGWAIIYDGISTRWRLW